MPEPSIPSPSLVARTVAGHTEVVVLVEVNRGGHVTYG